MQVNGKDAGFERVGSRQKLCIMDKTGPQDSASVFTLLACQNMTPLAWYLKLAAACSFLELYNEETTDLLAVWDQTQAAK